MTPLIDIKTLQQENKRFQASLGVSNNNRCFGFIPAFQDVDTGQSYISCFADGSRAPVHLLDGLPESLIVERSEEGLVTRVKASVISGFLYTGIFYTRDQVAALIPVPTGT